MSKLYWHKLRDSTIKRLYKNGLTVDEVIRRYKQPDWCAYPYAIAGIMGCWSLIDSFNSRHEISVEYCSTCDYFIKREEKGNGKKAGT